MADAAQYVIDIAAKAAGIDASSAQLDQMAAQLTGAGAKAAAFEDAVARVGRQVEGATASSRAASAALATSKSDYDELAKASTLAAKAAEAAEVRHSELGKAIAASAANEARLASAVDSARSNLSGLQAAADAAKAALAAGQQQYRGFSGRGVDTELRRLKEEAEAANAAFRAGASDLRGLESQAAAAARKSAKLSSEMASIDLAGLRSEADAASRALEAHAADLAKVERRADDAARSEKALKAQLDSVRQLTARANDRLGDAATKLSTFRGALGDVGGPVGELGERLLYPAQALVDLKERFGSTVATATVAVVGFAAVTAAVVAMTAAFVAGVGAIAAYAVKLGDTARSASLTREAFDALNPSLASLPFEDVAADTGVADAELRKIAKDLREAKVKTDDMAGALRAVAIRQALGQGSTSEFIADMKKAKRSVSDFSAATQAQLGGIVARQMLGLEAQGVRLRSNLARLFGGLNIDPALGGMQTLVGLFDETSATGKALKFLFEAIFQPLIDNAQKAAYFVEAFFIGLQIGFLTIYVGLKPLIKAVGDFFGFEDTTLADTLSFAKLAGEAVAVAIAALVVAFAAVAAIVGVVIGVFAAVAYVIIDSVVSAVMLAGKALSFLIDFWTALPGMVVEAVNAVVSAAGQLPAKILEIVNSVVAYFRDTPWAEIGADILRGLAAGITGSVGVVIEAVKAAIGGAIKSAKSILGIASPSKVFAGLGGLTGEGYAAGVEAEQAAADKAVADLVQPPSATELAAAPAPVVSAADNQPRQAPLAAGGPQINLQGAHFKFYGVKDAEHAQQAFEEMLTRVFEGDALQLGAEAAT